MNYSECIIRTGRIALAGLVLIIGAALLPSQAEAQVPPVLCADLLVDTGADSDNDGFTDFQECTGITTIGTTPVVVPWCGAPNADGLLPTRDRCMDPNSRDLFAILEPAPTGSLLPAVQSPNSTTPYNPFLPFTAHGINFTGLNALGLAVHKLNPNEAALNRTVSAAVLGLPAPKAIKVAESVDVNGVILGNCQYGTPSGLDGCVIYTRRTQNFIASACGSEAAIQTVSGGPSDAQQVLWAYSTYLTLHEAGHSLGGLTGEYNSRFGGYHYKPGAGLVMDQAVTYTLKGGVCKFFISPNWNPTLDPQAVRLK
jgi:hypothetical protein